MEILQSRLLSGFVHGFTTRRGGVSAAPYDSLNLGGVVGDDPASVDANWARLRKATGLGFARVRQVHGRAVFRAVTACGPKEEADAVLSTERGLAACVSVADCVPILLADPASGAVAAVHAGWRGTIARVASQAVAALVDASGTPPLGLVAAIGPSIGPCCYEVSPDLAERFQCELGAEAARCDAAPRVDLWLANERVLHEAGLAATRIDVLRRCTSCERDLFFSHRRDRGITGRQIAYIAAGTPTRLS